AQVRLATRDTGPAHGLRAPSVPDLYGGLRTAARSDPARKPHRDPLRGFRRGPYALAAGDLRRIASRAVHADGAALRGLPAVRQGLRAQPLLPRPGARSPHRARAVLRV